MSKDSKTPDWSNDPPAPEPNFENSDAPTMQAFDSSSVPPATPPPPQQINYGQASQPAKSKTWIWIVVIIAVLLLCCCCCAGIGVIGSLSGQDGGNNFFNNFSFLIGYLA